MKIILRYVRYLYGEISHEITGGKITIIISYLKCYDLYFCHFNGC